MPDSRQVMQSWARGLDERRGGKVKSENERRISALVLRYLASVAVGCGLVGVAIVLVDVFARGSSPVSASYFVVMAVILGTIPGALLALPGMLVGMWLRRRYSGLDTAWVWLLGLASGLIVFLPIYFVSKASGSTFVAIEFSAVFMLAGAVAAVVFSKLDDIRL